VTLSITEGSRKAPCLSAWGYKPQFSRHATRDLPGSVVLHVIFAEVLTVLARLVRLSKLADMAVPHRSLGGATIAVFLSGLAYVLYYLVFGAIAYQYFTKGYYPEAEKMIAPLGLWFWVIQFARGLLMTLSVVPFMLALRMKRWHAAIAVGLLIWITGGAGPLVVPDDLMGGRQRFIHTVEIFTQNFSLGVTAVLLFRPRSDQLASSVPAPPWQRTKRIALTSLGDRFSLFSHALFVCRSDDLQCDVRRVVRVPKGAEHAAPFHLSGVDQIASPGCQHNLRQLPRGISVVQQFPVGAVRQPLVGEHERHALAGQDFLRLLTSSNRNHIERKFFEDAD